MKKARIVVLISGGGSNLQAIMDACASGKLNAEVVAVFSNRRKAYGLVRAKQAGIACVYAPLKRFMKGGRTRFEYDADVAAQVLEHAPDLVVLAGWMHVLSGAFIDRFADRLINLHPALPGELPGTCAIERAFEEFERGARTRSGVMVHRVIPEIDAGEPIVVREVAFTANDTFETFAERLHATEHELIVDAIDRCIGPPPTT